ncbi:hypothetical protein Tco_0600908 [Tanacetum coccineum]
MLSLTTIAHLTLSKFVPETSPFVQQLLGGGGLGQDRIKKIVVNNLSTDANNTIYQEGRTIAILDFDLKKFREMVDVYDFVCIQVSEKDVQDMFDPHLKLDCRQLKLGYRQEAMYLGCIPSQDLYQYENNVDPETTIHFWEERAKIRFRVVNEEVWDGILASWMIEKWKKRSVTGKNRYQYENNVDPETARHVWEERAKIRFRVVNEEDWDGILASWMTEKWKKRSATGVQTEKKFQGMKKDRRNFLMTHNNDKNFLMTHVAYSIWL